MDYYNIFNIDDKQCYVSTNGNIINDGSENIETKQLYLIPALYEHKFNGKIISYYIIFYNNNYNNDVKSNGITLEYDTGNNTVNKKYLLNDNGTISTKKGDKEFKLKKEENKIFIENTNYYLKEFSINIITNNLDDGIINIENPLKNYLKNYKK
jgi:hypothetical protein